MIYATEKGDLGLVLLNGVEQLDCFQCDTEKGIVWKYKRDKNDKLVMVHENNELQGIAIEVMYGEVEFIPMCNNRHMI